MNKKKLIPIIGIAAVISLIIICIFFLLINREEKNTSKQWVFRQYEYLDTINNYTENMDDVFALYSINGITEQTFQEEISILKKELEVIKTIYENDKKEFDISPTSYSYASKRGIDGFENIFVHLEKLLNEVSDGNERISSEIVYIYLSYQTLIEEDINEYLTSYILLKYNE